MKGLRIMIMRCVLLAMAVVCCSSCDDFLNEPPADRLPAARFYRTLTQADQGVNGIYADLRFIPDYEYGLMAETRSDNTWVNPTPNGQRDYSDIGTFRAGASTKTFENAWNAWYKVIYDANVALAALGDGCDFDAERRSCLDAEARFLRGWAYFELVRLFGSVPVSLSPISPSEAASVPQSEAVSVLEDVVIPDLRSALTLPKRGEGPAGIGSARRGRADRVAALAMLARVYMTMLGFPYHDEGKRALATEALNDVLASQDDYFAPTIDGWRAIWMPEDSPSPHVIFSIQYRSGGTGNPYIFNIVKNVPRSYVGGAMLRKGGNFSNNDIFVEKTLRHELARLHSSGEADGRGEGWSVLDGFEAEPDLAAYPTEYEDMEVRGLTLRVAVNSMIYKPLPSVAKCQALGLAYDYSRLLNHNDWPVEFPVLRIEDMMLLRAELYAEAGNVTEALALVNAIRLRAGCDAAVASTPAEALQVVERERRLEFLGEGVRWFDEVRRGTWRQDVLSLLSRYREPSGTSPSFVSEGRYLFPIPQNQMAISSGLYVQNPGY